MSLINQAFIDLGELRIWFNDKSGVSIKLADMQEIIPLRWNYFKENWEFILGPLTNSISAYPYPDMLKKQLESLTELIRIQRHDANKKVNPFSRKGILSDYYAVWDSISLDSIPLTKEETSIADNKVKRIRRFIKTDFVRIRQSLVGGRDEISDTIGLSDTDYNATFDRSSTPQLRSARIKDISDMQTLQEAIGTVDYILANTASLTTTNVDPFALARLNANNPDVEIVTGLSGQLVRMYFGDSLQTLATRYLGSPDRWLEIAIANGLKPPYVDEIGEAIPIASNGSDSQLNIARLDGNSVSNRNKLYINQVVFLQSDTVKFPDQRSILNIKEIPISGEIVLELSREPNLSQYQTIDSAHIRVFKPNTINSNFMVLIPSPSPANNPSSTKETPFFLLSKGEDEKRAGVDLLLDSTNDITFTSSGDFQLSYGLSNAIQAMQLKLMAERGQSTRHLEFGLPSVIGVRANDTAAIKNALITGINDVVGGDSRFSRIETLDVAVGQGSAIISLVVRLAGTGTQVPISFTINVG